MDPGTIISVVELTGKALVTLAEVAKVLINAPNSLATVIGETNKMYLQLQRFKSIQRDLPHGSQVYLNQQVNNVQCQDIVARLSGLTSKIQPHDKMGLDGRVKWLRHKSTVDKLVSDLRNEADRLSNLLLPEQLSHLLGVSDQLLGNTNKIDEKVERVIHMLSQLQLSQPAVHTEQQSFDQNGIFSSYAATGIAWYGQWRCKPGQDLSMPYFRDRHNLAEAAYWGNWASVKRILDRAESTYGQKWINTTRIREVRPSLSKVKALIFVDKSTDTREPSGFTALHQAAHHGDPTACADLLRAGAWRTLRTNRNRSSKPRSTPIDIARKLGWSQVYEHLSPTLRRPLDPETLVNLRTSLHALIRKDFEEAPGVHLDCFDLPEPEVLTEFDRSRLWFPLDPELPDTRAGRAVHLALDGEELVAVMRWGKGKAERKNYRIAADGTTREVEQAVLLS